VAAALKPHPVIIRTLDLGGDKSLSHLQVAPEMNPFPRLAGDPLLPPGKGPLPHQLRATCAPAPRAT